MSKKRSMVKTTEPPKKGKPIRDRDEVVFFPSAAKWDNKSERWVLQIAGAVFDPEKIKVRKKLMVRLLGRFMKIPREELKGEIFQERIRPFTANALKGRGIRIRAGSQQFDLEKKTKRNGHFSATVRLTQDQVDTLVEEGSMTNRILHYHLLLDGNDDRVVPGRAHLLLPDGNSVISDIDDTIKMTNVGNRSELLKNTFLRMFEPIQGMALKYRSWAETGADFHYVSASPWQLINPLSEFFNTQPFPYGTFNLRVFRWRDSVVRRVVSEKWIGKAKVIRRIIKDFPDRKYVLVGDSVERDPELYAHLAEDFSRQISAIFIRQVPGFEMTDGRIDKIRSQIKATQFEKFTTHSDLPEMPPF